MNSKKAKQIRQLMRKNGLDPATSRRKYKMLKRVQKRLDLKYGYNSPARLKNDNE